MPTYKGTFNYQGEIHTLTTRRHCPNESSAYSVLTRALALKLQRLPAAIRRYFSGQKNNYEIKEV